MTPSTASVARQARAVRARTIRRRVIAAGLSLFVATWLFIALVLISGHDPALAAHKASTTSTATTASSAWPTTSTATSASPTTTTTSSASSVTTRQS
jgi:hypothetical protein